MSMDLVVLEHSVEFAATPAEVYRALMDSKQHAAFTGMPAKIAAKVGGAFSTCGGNNFGFTLALEPGARIAQAWSHRDLPPGHYTLVEFKLSKSKRGTKLTFTQIGVPRRAAQWLNRGWSEAYWQPLAIHLDARHAS
ncbi:MAG: SRPBCC domain-containing protein [Planctomycetes bacterium]|nr:SRPBCC domain-containing protein [Planctomycetota bacterium]